LFPSLVQYFSRLLAGVFFFHALCDSFNTLKFTDISCRVYKTAKVAFYSTKHRCYCCQTPPTRAHSMTTSQGGVFQNTSSTKATAANTKSDWDRIALVQTG